jgi:hypothetical protein
MAPTGPPGSTESREVGGGVVRPLGQDLAEHLVPFLRDEAVHLQVGGLDGIDVDELVEDRSDVGPREGLLAREHLEGAHAQ